MLASPKQMSYIASLANRDWDAALPLLQAAWDESDYAQKYDRVGEELTKSSWEKWLGRAIDRGQASELIDDLKEL